MRRKIRLRIALPTFFAVFVAITGVSILLINYTTSIAFLNRFAVGYLTQVGNTVLEKTINHIGPAAKIAEMNGVLLDPARHGNDYLKGFNEITIREMQSYPQFALIYFGGEDGGFWMNAREEDLSIATEVIERMIDTPESERILREAKELPSNTAEEKRVIEERIAPILRTLWWYRDTDGRVARTAVTTDYIYDPRWRPWYKNARESGQTRWTGAYLFSSSGRLHASGKPGITVSSPVLPSGTFVGAVGVDIILEELSEFLKTLEIGVTGRAFITNAEGATIALHDYDQVVALGNDGQTRLNRIPLVEDTAVATSYALVREQLGLRDGQDLAIDTPQDFSFVDGGTKYLAYYTPFPSDFGLDWFVGVVVPENDFVADLKRGLIFMVGLSAVTLALVIVFSVSFSRTITMPIRKLTDEANRIRELQVDETEMSDSLFREIHNMTAAFKSMKAGLRSFTKYVPTEIVRYLIQSGEEAVLGGKDENITMLFTDVADFTSIAETMQPDDLVVHLGEYLGALSSVILEHEGTVDKYMGDSIMAFWNAPVPVEDHAFRACFAALRCIERARELHRQWKAEGKPLLTSRIGVHTGNVIVGNMGSQKRLNYTVVGDSVNLASRLEGLSKIYGTSILISEDTHRLVADRMVCRRLDRVVVKGKTNCITIYELLGVKGAPIRVDQEFIGVYESALDSYFARDWREAQARFRRAYAIARRDRPCAILYGRCKLYAENPPPENWDGGYVLAKK
jgi:adenylate cyclase